MSDPEPALPKRAPEPDERFHHLIDAITDYAIYMLDASGVVSTWSTGAHRLKGYSADEIIGQHFSLFYQAEDRASGRPMRILETVKREGRYEEEAWRVRKDGTRFWASVVITPLRSESGELIGFAKVTRDLTERRAAAESLRRSEERFRMLVEGVTDYAIYMLDPKGIVTTWNVGAQRLKGYSATEIVGRSFSLFFPEADVQARKPERELMLAASEGRFEDEGWRVRKDGSRFWANVILTPLRDTDGTLIGFAKVTRDLTARRQTEDIERKLFIEQAARAASEENQRRLQESEENARRAALQAEEAARRAEAAGRAKDDFLATVSHELRTPLNAITGWASILKTAKDTSSLARGIDVIYRNAVSQARIIDDILDVARIASGKLHLEFKPTDVFCVVSEAIELLRPSAATKEIAIHFSADDALPSLLADPERLRQVVWNLLSNAIKFSNAHDRVIVVLRRIEAGVELSVSDTGSGITPEFLPLVFERFRQADGAANRRVGGLGLGLTIVRHIVELHAGEVSAESPGLGKGSTFRVRLPAHPGADDEAHAAAVTPTPTNRRPLLGARILVVDDDSDAREVLEEVLRSAGAEVMSADSAEAALALLTTFRAELLVSDVGMPVNDGYALIRELRARGSEAGGDIPALALTAYTRAQDRALALAAGFTAHMAKPIDVAELVSTAVELLARTRP